MTRERACALHQSLCREHIDEAAFLWSVRDRALRMLNMTVRQMTDLDAALEAHIDGLRVALEEGWLDEHDVVAGDDPGEVFVLGVVTLEQGARERPFTRR